MDEKRLFEILQDLGLPKREADIYMMLSRKGPQKAHSVASHLGIDRAQTYRSLTSLQEKGVVELTIEAPTRYIAVPIETLMDSHITDKKSEVARIEAERTALLDYIKTIRSRDQGSQTSRFQVIVGRNRIFSRISQMVSQSRKELLSLTTSVGLIQEDLAGVLDAIVASATGNKDVQFKMLANITAGNLKVIKGVISKSPAGKSHAQWRHVDLGSRFLPRFVIKDEEEAMLCMIAQDDPSLSPQGDTGLWITSRVFVSTLRASFMEIWRGATHATDRIDHLETGKPIEETLVLREPVEAQARLQEALDSANKDIIYISSAAGINKISDDDPFRNCADRGVKVRLMAPIDLDNLDSAHKLSRLYEVKHVSISYMTMMIVDGRILFMFEAAPLRAEGDESPFYMRNLFYTNNRKYVERAAELMRDIWKRGTLVSEIDSGGPLSAPPVKVPSAASVSEVVNVMLKHGIGTVLVSAKGTIMGVIDQRDILRNLQEGRRRLDEMTAAEIMSTPVLTLDSDTPLMEALRIMREKRMPKLAILRKGKLVAMLT